MKSTTFLKPLEYNLEVIGEKWHQGDKLKGTLRVKNHSAETLTLPFIKLTLASGNYKKLKARDKKGWDNLSEKDLADSLALNANEEKEYPWEFQLSEDCRITDKDGSLYLNFSDKNEDWPVGLIELPIVPKVFILQFLEIFENFLRFKVAQTKYAKGMIEIKLNAPKSRELAHIENLVLRVKEVEKTLTLEFNFSLSVLEMSGTAMVAQKKTKTVEKTLTAKEYLIYGSSINQDYIITFLNSVVKEVAPKMMF